VNLYLKIIFIMAMIFMAGFNAAPCMASEIDAEMFGFSYHFNKHGADKDAPDRLNHDATWVFNPGIALGYDFRRDIHTGGLSPIVNGGFFENCANFPFYYLGAGGRYRKFLTKKLFVEMNLMGVVTEGNDSDDKAYKPAIMPFADFGVGYDFGKFLTTVDISYVPQSAGGKITDGTDMLFLNMEVSF